MREEVWQSLEEGGLLLTAGARLARQSKSDYAVRQALAGREAWPTPPILSFEGWLARCWQQALLNLPEPPSALLLTPAQEAWVWRQIIQSESDSSQLFDLPSTVAAATEAWNLARGWKLDWKSSAWRDFEDTERFLKWANAYRKRCQQKDWLPPAEWTPMLAQLFAGRQLPPPGQVWMAGFDEFTPAQAELLAALERAGTRVTNVHAAEPPNNVAVAVTDFDKPEFELEGVARWAASQPESRRIGVVVPDLGARRSALEAAFNRVFHPDHPPGESRELAYDISLGQPLAGYAMISAALDWLAVCGERYPKFCWTQLSGFLRSPFFCGSESERFPRAQIELTLRRRRWTWISLPHLQRFTQVQDCPLLAGAIRQAMELLHELVHAERSFSEWVAAMVGLLHAVGWPGERPLSSDEYQMQGAWFDLLNSLCLYDQVSEPVTMKQAVELLRQRAGEVLFQPEARAARVQVLGWLEAAGLQFDALWVMGLNDERVPARTRPNPFIPSRLQADHKMPHSSAERELEFARRRLDALISSARMEMRLSYAKKEGDSECRVSPLLARLPTTPPPALPISPRTAVLEEVIDEQAPVLAAEARRGNSSVVEDQAHCGFRAFARHRLVAQGLERQSGWLTPSDRGTLLHATLCQVWKTLNNSDTLAAMSPDEMRQLVGDAADAGIADADKAGLWFSQRDQLRQAEWERLTLVVRQWLEVERRRPAFRVLATEAKVDAEFGGLKLRLKVDRVDEQQKDGKLIVIDYKSGAAAAHWDPASLLSPQLPLYAVTAQEADRIGGIALARLRTSEMKMVGQAEPELGIEGLGEPKDAEGNPESWPQRMDEWRAALNELVAAYCNGRAPVAPVKPASTCRYCDLPSLCRVKEGSGELIMAAGLSPEDGEEVADGE